jgi:uncharacterized phage protein (TIGR01671 family)
MREIKFRIMLNGVWYYWGFIKLHNSESIVFVGLPTSNQESCSMEELRNKSQQFIGRIDRKRKEIYEGDIVSIFGANCNKCSYYSKELNCLTDDECPVIEIVRDVVTMERFPVYWLRHENFGYEGEKLMLFENCEVIGNICENPELLETLHNE